MDIQQISPDRLRVVLDLSDLDKYNLDYLSISKDSPGTKKMLREILTQAARQAHFISKNSKLVIEVLPGKNSGCILYLTRTPQPGRVLSKMSYESNVHSGDYILSCENLDDIIGAINHFADYPDVPVMKSSLYSLNTTYYLIFSPVSFGLDPVRFSALLADLSEYGKTVKATPVREAMLCEHGAHIADRHAVESFIRYFS